MDDFFWLKSLSCHDLILGLPVSSGVLRVSRVNPCDATTGFLPDEMLRASEPPECLSLLAADLHLEGQLVAQIDIVNND